MLLTNSAALAGTPFTKALLHGRTYAHRPYYKPYHKHHGLFGRR
ncbi:hypothetical protein [Hymenobacter cavernae]|nr:hypothetical protein [Hymenobacter cavernae]